MRSHSQIKNPPLMAVLAAFVIVMLFAQPISAQEATPPSSTKNWYEQSVWDNPDRDFKWYPPDPPSAPISPKAEPEKSARPKRVEDFKSTKEVAAEVERLKDLAVLTRKPEHVKAFLAFQQQVMDNSAEYADVVRRLVWTTPELDYQQRRPTNNSAIASYDKTRTSTERKTIEQLSKSYGLFFFYRSDCPYCHQLSPMLKNFSKLYGMDVLPISMDGGVLPDFPNARPNNGLAEQLQITTVPALYLAGRDRTIQPISFGLIAQSDLIERIHVLTQTKPGQDF